MLPRSATQRKLVVPHYRLNSFGRRRFSVAGPSTWNWYFQTSAEDVHFCKILMTKCMKRIRDLFEYALYKFTLYLLTYLLTYLPSDTGELVPP